MISVAKEKDLGWPIEQCYFCNKGTQYWSIRKDIPVCRSCAEWKNDWNLPDKEVWVGTKTGNKFSNADSSPPKRTS